MDKILDGTVKLSWQPDFGGPIGRIGPGCDMKKIQTDEKRRKHLRNVACYLKQNGENEELFTILQLCQSDLKTLEEKLEKLRRENDDIPPNISVSLQFDDSNAEYFDNVVAYLKQNDIKYETNGLEMDVTYGDVKPEYLEQVEKGKVEHGEKERVFDEIVESLKKLGYDTSEMFMEGNKVPEGWRFKTEKVRGNIRIKMSKKEEMYELLLEKGILEKGYPAWYKYGEF